MKKKNIIILCVCLVAILGLLITLTFTLFSLKTITVDFRTSTLNLTATSEEIIESGKFGKGSVLFYNKDKAVKRIEEKYPYIKVINIETKFPSSFVIHVAERQEVFVVQSEEKNYYCDENLKILKISTDAYENNGTSPVLLKGIEIESELKEGDHIENAMYVDIYSAFLQSNLKLSMQKEIFEEIEFKKELDTNAKQEYVNAYIKLFSGQTIKILDVNYGLKYKANLAFKVYSSLYTFIGKDYRLQSGETITLTKEDLDSMLITCQSYYDRNHHKESETYFLLSF